MFGISISKWASMDKHNHIQTSMPSNFSKAWDPSVLPSPHHHHQASWDKNLSYCAAINDWRSTILGWEIGLHDLLNISICWGLKPLPPCQQQVKFLIGIPESPTKNIMFLVVTTTCSYWLREPGASQVVCMPKYSWNVIWSHSIISGLTLLPLPLNNNTASKLNHSSTEFGLYTLYNRGLRLKPTCTYDIIWYHMTYGVPTKIDSKDDKKWHK